MIHLTMFVRYLPVWIIGFFVSLSLTPCKIDAQPIIRVLSHRYPALEFYKKAMEGALPEVKVEASLMPQDKVVELTILNLSKGSDAYDVVWTNEATLQRYAANGWLEPLDELWKKYTEAFDLGDFPDEILNNFRYKGELYAIPFNSIVMFFFYRADLFKEKGFSPPITFEEYRDLAKAFNSKQMAGTIMSLKPVDAALNEIHWYFNSHGAQWFDENWKPTFNSIQGQQAIERMKEMTAYAAPGYTSHANDESTINLQQGLAAMGLQWASRAASMDDPNKSRVVGKIEWSLPPKTPEVAIPGQRFVTDGYAISRFSKVDKDLIFRMLATASNREKMQEGAKLLLPPRKSVLQDFDLQKQNRHWGTALEALEVAKPFPSLPEFLEVGEIVTRRVHQTLTGEMEVKQALDTAAQEVLELLAQRGYYK
jgi:ABC-type glycerol-3-phosphate transport system substrate-binding protein